MLHSGTPPARRPDGAPRHDDARSVARTARQGDVLQVAASLLDLVGGDEALAHAAVDVIAARREQQP